jgi:uncharacterized protein DUF6204
MAEVHTFRVTVRGRFLELSQSQRQRLSETLDDHHVTKAAYTAEGTFTYDANLDFFGLRYEIRTQGDEREDVAANLGLRQAENFLHLLGFGYQQLRVTTTDMQSIWDATARGRRS